MNTPKIADYTTRKGYMQNYAKNNREAINARKRAWRAARKNLGGGEMKSYLQRRDEACSPSAQNQ